MNENLPAIGDNKPSLVVSCVDVQDTISEEENHWEFP